jgi:histidinol phosphatase-like enzyme
VEQLKPLVILDRDGTLIKEPKDFQIDSFEKFELVDGVLSGLALLKKQEVRIVLNNGLRTWRMKGSPKYGAAQVWSFE